MTTQMALKLKTPAEMMFQRRRKLEAVSQPGGGENGLAYLGGPLQVRDASCFGRQTVRQSHNNRLQRTRPPRLLRRNIPFTFGMVFWKREV